MIHALSVALVGQNALVREGLRRILTEADFTVTCSVDRAELAARGDGPAPQLVVIDTICGAQAVEQLRVLRRDLPDTRQVVLVDQFSFDDMAQCFRVGTDGYIVKEISCEPLIASLRLAAMGEKVMPSQLADALPSGDHHSPIEVTPVSGTAHLSDREAEILRCLVLGYPNKVISRHLRISEATVKVHVKAVLRKLRVQNRTQAAIWGVAHGYECANDDDHLPITHVVGSVSAARGSTAIAARANGSAPLPIGSSPLSATRLPGRYAGPIQSGAPIAVSDPRWAGGIVANEIDDDQLAFVAAGFDEQPMFERRPAATG